MDKDAQGELDLGGEAAAERGETVKGREAPKEQSEGKVHWLPIGTAAQRIVDQARRSLRAECSETPKEANHRKKHRPPAKQAVVIILRRRSHNKRGR